MNRKKFLSLFLAFLLLLGISGCGSKTNNTIKTDSVVIAVGSEPETLDPTQGWGHGNSPIVQSTLVKYTADLDFENDLASGYELSADGLTWIFTLRNDAISRMVRR